MIRLSVAQMQKIAEELSPVFFRGTEKRADAARNRMVAQNRAKSGLQTSSPAQPGKYVGGTFGGSTYDNGNGTVTVRKGGQSLTVNRNAWDKSRQVAGRRNMQFMPAGALASGVIDSAADVSALPQSFEPVVNAFSPTLANAYSKGFGWVTDKLRGAAGYVRAATDGNPATVAGQRNTYNAKDPANPNGVQAQNISKAVSWGPRAYLSWRYAAKPMIRTGKWLSTGTSAPATALRVAGGAGFARHGGQMIDEGHPVAGAATTVLGVAGMAGPSMQQASGMIPKAIATVQNNANRYLRGPVSSVSRWASRLPFVGRYAGTTVDKYIPASLAVSPDPHMAVPRR